MVRGIPDHFAVFQRADHPFEVFTVDHALIGAHTAPGLQKIDHRIIVRAIDADAGSLHAKHPCAYFERQEVNANQQHAGFFRLQGMHWLHARSGHVKPARHAFVGPEPGHSGFHQTHADRFEILAQHPLALLCAHVWKTKFQIAVRNLDASFHKALSEMTKTATDAIDHRIGKLHQQP
ncbi:hypothetical protein D3C81_1518710 [compost metagenome]